MPQKPLVRYWIPRDLRPLAARLQEQIEAVADRLAVDAGDVAQAFLEYAWLQWRRGNLTLLPRPNPTGRKARLTLVWVEVGDGAGKPPAAAPLPSVESKPDYFGYRMANAEVWNKRIREIAQEHDLPVGAVLIALLAPAVEDYMQGKIALHTFPRDATYTLDGWKINLHRTPAPAT